MSKEKEPIAEEELCQYCHEAKAEYTLRTKKVCGACYIMHEGALFLIKPRE